MARAVAPTWDILICSLAYRTDKLTELLTALSHQIAPGVGVRVYRDNGEAKVGEKRQRLMESSTARYVSFVDDDDLVHREYVTKILDALRSRPRPDYVGFRVMYTEGGYPLPRDYRMKPVSHSLAHGGWHDGETLLRDISHLNPIRRSLAEQAEWSGGYGEDARWASQLRALGIVKREAFIDEELYWYRHRLDDTFVISSTKDPLADPPAAPVFDFVTWVN